MSHNPRLTTKTSSILTQETKTGTLTPTTYTYDNRGNVASITDPRGQSTTYSYDIVDNLTQVSYPNGSTEHFSYDKMVTCLQEQYLPQQSITLVTTEGICVRTTQAQKTKRLLTAMTEAKTSRASSNQVARPSQTPTATED